MSRRRLVGQALIVLVFVLITVFVIYRDNGVREMMTNPPPTTAP